MRVNVYQPPCIIAAFKQEHGTKASSELHLRIPIIQHRTGERSYSIHFLRSLITLYNVPTPIPTTQVMLNQHAGVLLFMKVLSLAKHRLGWGGAGRLDDLRSLDGLDDAWLMIRMS